MNTMSLRVMIYARSKIGLKERVHANPFSILNCALYTVFLTIAGCGIPYHDAIYGATTPDQWLAIVAQNDCNASCKISAYDQLTSYYMYGDTRDCEAVARYSNLAAGYYYDSPLRATRTGADCYALQAKIDAYTRGEREHRQQAVPNRQTVPSQSNDWTGGTTWQAPRVTTAQIAAREPSNTAASCDGILGGDNEQNESGSISTNGVNRCPKMRIVGTRVFFTVGQMRQHWAYPHGAIARNAAEAINMVNEGIGDNFKQGSLTTIDWECPATETWAVLFLAYPNSGPDQSDQYRVSKYGYGCGFSDPRIALRRAYEYCHAKGICNVSKRGWVEFIVVKNDGNLGRITRHSTTVRCMVSEGRYLEGASKEDCDYRDVFN